MTEDRSYVERFPEYARTLDCVHCGLCIPHCPTHGVTGREADSPRGRIHLMRAYAEGRTDLSEGTWTHLDQCIVCRACESVCPSGIHMGEMMESFREEHNRTEPSGAAGSRLGRYFLRRVLPDRERIAKLSDLLGIYQGIGLGAVVGGLLRVVAPGLGRLHGMQPKVPPRRERRVPTDRDRPAGYPALGERRARVALFLGCVASEWFAPVHRATIRVLQRNGCDVIVPHAQTCCGALHRHAGCLDDARELEGRNRAAFPADIDAIVVNAAGCGAALKEPLTGDGGPPVKDVMELLHELEVVAPERELRVKVAYDQPCHLVHGQKIGAEVVEEVLGRIPGLQLVPLERSERCCGAGGIYNLLHPEMADPVLEDKVACIVRSGAEIVATGNPGCAMQIGTGLRRQRIEVLHPVELLDRAYGSG